MAKQTALSEAIKVPSCYQPARYLSDAKYVDHSVLSNASIFTQTKKICFPQIVDTVPVVFSLKVHVFYLLPTSKKV